MLFVFHHKEIDKLINENIIFHFILFLNLNFDIVERNIARISY